DTVLWLMPGRSATTAAYFLSAISTVEQNKAKDRGELVSRIPALVLHCFKQTVSTLDGCSVHFSRGNRVGGTFHGSTGDGENNAANMIINVLLTGFNGFTTLSTPYG
ncbi:hypothetical protein L9F63_018378, partial [Diploptera punctata]